MIYFFDGTKASFLTAFVLAFHDENPLLTASQKQLSLGQECVFVNPDPVRAKKAEKRLLSFDAHCMHDLDLLLRSGTPNHEQYTFEYLKLIAKRKRPVRGMFADPRVHIIDELLRKIHHEIEHMKGFVRFMESASGALYAPITPDHDICDLIAPHFSARLPHYPFVIHDVKRKKAAVYDGEHLFLAPLESAEIALSAKEEEWQSLWKIYYQSVNIPSRERLKQMRGYLPVRYRKFMPEFH